MATKNEQKVSVIITAFKEEKTVKEAVRGIVFHNMDLANRMEVLVIAPDQPTLDSAKAELDLCGYKNYQILKDSGEGKPNALNMAVEKANGDILIFTDGDMHISDNAIKDLLKHFEDEEVGGVSGRPTSSDARNSIFGYYSHLFCEAAHKRRLGKHFVPMSGYLFAIRRQNSLFPLPNELRAEDAYISSKIIETGKKIIYEPEAIAYVKFPKNLNDWIKQKTRSLGGNIQLEKFTSKKHSRSILQDLQMALFPLTFAKTPKEFGYSILLYPIRLYLWIKIYTIHKQNKYKTGAWERIESSKG